VVEFRNIINGCSVNVRQLTDRELKQLITNNQMRMAVLDDEIEILRGEQIRRLPDQELHRKLF